MSKNKYVIGLDDSAKILTKDKDDVSYTAFTSIREIKRLKAELNNYWQKFGKIYRLVEVKK